jgi:hypothetical protein
VDIYIDTKCDVEFIGWCKQQGQVSWRFGAFNNNVYQNPFTCRFKNIADIKADPIDSSKLLKNCQSYSHLVKKVKRSNKMY